MKKLYVIDSVVVKNEIKDLHLGTVEETDYNGYSTDIKVIVDGSKHATPGKNPAEEVDLMIPHVEEESQMIRKENINTLKDGFYAVFMVEDDSRWEDESLYPFYRIICLGTKVSKNTLLELLSDE